MIDHLYTFFNKLYWVLHITKHKKKGKTQKWQVQQDEVRCEAPPLNGARHSDSNDGNSLGLTRAARQSSPSSADVGRPYHSILLKELTLMSLCTYLCVANS